MWGDTESYDAADLSAAQEKIAMWVLSTSQGHLWLNSPIDSLAEEYLRRRTPADNQRGLELAREAWRNGRTSKRRRHPDRPAHQSLAEGWADPPSRTIEEMVDVASALLAVAPQWGQAHLFFGFASLLSGDRERAVAAIERGCRDLRRRLPVRPTPCWDWRSPSPSDPKKRSPRSTRRCASVRTIPERFAWEHFRAVAHFAAGRYQEARDACTVRALLQHQ